MKEYEYYFLRFLDMNTYIIWCICYNQNLNHVKICTHLIYVYAIQCDTYRQCSIISLYGPSISLYSLPIVSIQPFKKSFSLIIEIAEHYLPFSPRTIKETFIYAPRICAKSGFGQKQTLCQSIEGEFYGP